jgi:hypothetical protein
MKEEVWHQPAMQKAEVNVVFLSGIANNPDKLRDIYIDNQYSSQSLLFFCMKSTRSLLVGMFIIIRKV